MFHSPLSDQVCAHTSVFSPGAVERPDLNYTTMAMYPGGAGIEYNLSANALSALREPCHEAGTD